MPVTFQIHDKQFVPYLPAGMITEKVKSIAAAIDRDYSGKRPLFIAILNGSFIFAADLFRHITIEAEIAFVRLVSYTGSRSSGTVVTAIGLDTAVQDRPVILLEDIIDTGRTLHAFLPELYKQKPASTAIAALLVKPDACRFPVNVDYKGFDIPNRFVVGYGLDYDGLGRNIPDILISDRE